MKRILTLVYYLTLICNFSFASEQLYVKKIAKLPKKMYETSGLVFYKNKYLITHNDGGNKSEIYILNLKGELIKTIDITSTKNHDWEDLAQDEFGNLYIGDFGNNYNKRDNLSIYILKNGFLNKDEVEPKEIKFWYEDQEKFPPSKKKLNYDCEAFFYKDNALYLFTKCRTKPFTGVSKIYKLPTKKGKHKAQLIGQMTFCKANWQTCSVTAADYFPATKTLAVLTYSKLYLISNFHEDKFWEGKIKAFNISGVKQREAIAFASKNSWFLTDEYRKGLGGGNLYALYFKKNK
jgi:hypothetical protein